MRRSNFYFTLVILIVLVLSINARLFAQTVILTDTEVKEDDSAVKMLFSTNRAIPIECYDLSVPPQIVVDFMGEIYTNKPEIMMINKDVVKELRVVRGTRKNQELDESYYSVDFIIIDLKEPTRYDFDQGLTNAVLLVSKPGKAVGSKKAKAEPAQITKQEQPGFMPVPQMREKIPEPVAAPFSIEEKEYEKPVAKITPVKTKTQRRARKEKISAPQEETATSSKPTTVGKMKKKIKSAFTFDKDTKEKAARRQKVKSEDKQVKTRRRKIAKAPKEEKAKSSRRSSRRKRVTKEEKPEEPKSKAVSGEDARYQQRIDSALQDIKRKQQEVNQVNEELVRAEVALIEAKDEKQTLGKRIEDSSNKVDRLKQEYNESVQLTTYAKNAANAMWIEYSGAKTRLSNLLGQDAKESEIKAAQAKYDESKVKMGQAIKAAERAKEESNMKLLAHNNAVDDYNQLMDTAEDPQDSVEQAKSSYDTAGQKVASKKQELAAAKDELSEAERAYKQYQIEKADEEYKQSLFEIDMSIIQGKEDENRIKKEASFRQLEEARVSEQQQARAKEEAQMAALKRFEDEKKAEDKMTLHRRKAKVSPKRRKTQPVAKQPPPLVERKPREDVMKSALDLRNAGLEMQQAGDLDSAVKYYQQALISDPGYATVHNDLGILYEQKGLDEKAKMEYLNALKIDPLYYKAHSNLAFLYEKSGDYDKAYYHWKQRVELGQASDPWTQKAKEKMQLLEQRK